MTPELHRRASELFHDLVELPESERVARLYSACAGDNELRAEVERLLDADRAAADNAFLNGRAFDDAARAIASQDLPAPGTIIGRFRLDRQIGSGGMGVVYKAQDLNLDRTVAIKILPTNAINSKERIQRFQREARAASQLSHPNIVSIHAAGLEQGWHYIAMEFVEGQTVRQLIGAARPVDPKTILNLISQAASALSAAHDAGIVHRDIKPENLMVRPDGIVKVLDFGLAKLRETDRPPGHASELHTRAGNVPGTIQYLSPEQVMGEPAGPRSDLFSLGVVAYELATGVRPFEGSTDGAVFNAIVHRTPPRPSSIRASTDPELYALIMRLLEKDPELRFQTASDLRSSCRRIYRDSSAAHEARDANTGTLAQRPLGTGRTRLWWVLAAAAVLAVVSVVGLLWQQPPIAPRVTGILQLTHGGPPIRSFVTDGTRIYYAAGEQGPGAEVFQISTRGGEPIPMPRLTGMLPLDISPDRTEILFGQMVEQPGNELPLWIADTVGNPPRRLGGLAAREARWSPRGDEIAYTAFGPDLRIARDDGMETRIVATVPGLVHAPAWSPDGSRIRYTLIASNKGSLWEIAADGTGLRALLPEWTDDEPDTGIWTPDGRHYVFTSAPHGGRRDLCAVRETGLLSRLRTTHPLRLTNGPMSVSSPTISPDGRRVFLLGQLEIGELVRYEPSSQRWVPHISGLAGSQLEYSRDGKWVTYVTYPEGSIWRAASDGSNRLQLTAPPLYAMNPRWSPDGTRITAFGAPSGKPSHIYLLPANGGAVRQLTHGEGGPSGETDGSWSQDGTSIVYGVQSADQATGRHQSALRVIDVGTGRSTELPGSQGLWSPRWSPDGRWIAALGFPNKLWLYDVRAQARTELLSIGVGFPSWSADSKYVYFEDTSMTSWYRVRVADRKLERLVSLAGLRALPASGGWVGLTPGGSPMATRDKGSVEIYALDWELP